MPHLVDHFWFVLLSVLFPLYGRFFGYARLSRASPDQVPRVRRRLYRTGMLIQWTLTALTLVIWLWAGRPAQALGLAVRSSAVFWSSAAMVVVVAIVALVQRRRILGDPDALGRVRRQLGHVERMLPHDREELGLFVRLSFTAGICEELLYRGYVLWYLGHWMPPVVALLVASAIFGLGHSYQGPGGMVKTGVIGLMLGALYIASRSLYPGMALHALVDVYSGELGHAAFSQPPGDGERTTTAGAVEPQAAAETSAAEADTPV